MVDGLSNVKEALGPISRLHKPGVVVYACNLSSQEVEAGGSQRVQSHPPLHSGAETDLVLKVTDKGQVNCLQVSVSGPVESFLFQVTIWGPWHSPHGGSVITPHIMVITGSRLGVAHKEEE